MTAKTWFITGATSGFGRAFALNALAQGNNVAAAARDPTKLADIVAKAPKRVLAQRLDVTREALASIRDFADGMDGVQAGDPALAAVAVERALEAVSTPLRLQLSVDSVRRGAETCRDAAGGAGRVGGGGASHRLRLNRLPVVIPPEVGKKERRGSRRASALADQPAYPSRPDAWARMV